MFFEPGPSGPISSPGSSRSTPFRLSSARAALSAAMLGRWNETWSMDSGRGAPLCSTMSKASLPTTTPPGKLNIFLRLSFSVHQRALFFGSRTLMPKCPTCPSLIGISIIHRSEIEFVDRGARDQGGGREMALPVRRIDAPFDKVHFRAWISCADDVGDRVSQQ